MGKTCQMHGKKQMEEETDEEKKRHTGGTGVDIKAGAGAGVRVGLEVLRDIETDHRDEEMKGAIAHRETTGIAIDNTEMVATATRTGTVAKDAVLQNDRGIEANTGGHATDESQGNLVETPTETDNTVGRGLVVQEDIMDMKFSRRRDDKGVGVPLVMALAECARDQMKIEYDTLRVRCHYVTESTHGNLFNALYAGVHRDDPRKPT